MPAPPPSPRSRVRRQPKRGIYDRETIHAILDAGVVAHVGFVDEGQPVVVPMGYARDGERLLLHGSAGSRAMRRLADGAPCCVTVTHVDGMVLARSQFNHSMNYRSVMVLARGFEIEDEADKRRALSLLVDHLIPGRAADSREASGKELAATLVVAIPLDEAAAKVRTGPPGDDEADRQLPHWAGVLPYRTVLGTPDPAPDLAEGIELPDYLRR